MKKIPLFILSINCFRIYFLIYLFIYFVAIEEKWSSFQAFVLCLGLSETQKQERDWLLSGSLHCHTHLAVFKRSPRELISPSVNNFNDEVPRTTPNPT